MRAPIALTAAVLSVTLGLAASVWAAPQSIEKNKSTVKKKSSAEAKKSTKSTSKSGSAKSTSASSSHASMVKTAAEGKSTASTSTKSASGKSSSGKSTSTKSASTKSTSAKSASTSSSSSKTKSSKKQVASSSRYHRSSQQQPTPDRFKEIQQALASKGYFQGEADGQWGSSSVDALKRFQHDQNLTEDGKIGSVSLIALGLGPKRNNPEKAAPDKGSADKVPALPAVNDAPAADNPPPDQAAP